VEGRCVVSHCEGVILNLYEYGKMVLTGCCSACAAVGRMIGSGLRRDLMKSLAEKEC